MDGKRFLDMLVGGIQSNSRHYRLRLRSWRPHVSGRPAGYCVIDGPFNRVEYTGEQQCNIRSQ
jgi:hypothetical protein